MGLINHRLRAKMPIGEVVPDYRTIFLPINTGGVAGATSTADPVLAFAGAGDPVTKEVGTTGVTGVRFEANNDTHVWCPVHVPDDLDVKMPIDFRVLWSSDQTTVADTYTLTILYSELTVNSTVAVAAGATALSTAIEDDVNLVTASALQATEWGTLNGNTLTGTSRDGYYLSVTLKATSLGGTASSDLVIMHGVEIRYRPRYV